MRPEVYGALSLARRHEARACGVSVDRIMALGIADLYRVLTLPSSEYRDRRAKKHHEKAMKHFHRARRLEHRRHVR